MGSGVAVVGTGRIGAPTTEQLAAELPHERLLVVDGDRVEARNDYPPFDGRPGEPPKVQVLQAITEARLGPSDRRYFFQGFFPEDFSPALLRQLRVLVIATDNLRDRQLLEQAGRACGVRVVNVSGLDGVGQLTIYGEGPEHACMECELGPEYSLALPLGGTGGPGCGPSAATSRLLARETARVVKRLLQGEDLAGLGYSFVNGRRRHTFRLARSPRCASPAHRPVEWRTVRSHPGATLGRLLQTAGLDSTHLFNPVFARTDCEGCGAHWGHRYGRRGTACPSCGGVRPLVWQVKASDPLAGLPTPALGLPHPVCLRSPEGSLWVETALDQTPEDPLVAWLERTAPSAGPSQEVRNGC